MQMRQNELLILQTIRISSALALSSQGLDGLDVSPGA